MNFSANGSLLEPPLTDGGAAEHTDLSQSQELAEEEGEQEPEFPPMTVVSILVKMNWKTVG